MFDQSQYRRICSPNKLGEDAQLQKKQVQQFVCWTPRAPVRIKLKNIEIHGVKLLRVNNNNINDEYRNVEVDPIPA